MANEVLYFLLDLFFFSVVDTMIVLYSFKLFCDNVTSFSKINFILITLIIFATPRIFYQVPISQIFICIFISIYLFLINKTNFVSILCISIISISIIVFIDIFTIYSYGIIFSKSELDIIGRFVVFLISRIICFVLFGGANFMKVLLGGITRR